jgi:hypothetical protein
MRCLPTTWRELTQLRRPDTAPALATRASLPLRRAMPLFAKHWVCAALGVACAWMASTAARAQESAANPVWDARSRSPVGCAVLPEAVACRPGMERPMMPGDLPWRSGLVLGQPRNLSGLPGRADTLGLVHQKNIDDGDAALDRREFDRGNLYSNQRFIGIHLNGGARLGLRRKNGAPALIYRDQF